MLASCEPVEFEWERCGEYCTGCIYEGKEQCKGDAKERHDPLWASLVARGWRFSPIYAVSPSRFDPSYVCLSKVVIVQSPSIPAIYALVEQGCEYNVKRPDVKTDNEKQV